ncbi:MAG: hypothetical protein K0S00_1265 [Xanthobacteraceae bacterium]|jgi:hypothetical protein|nr:hypothetical protein [Xanthobacteraceae bacterium]
MIPMQPVHVWESASTLRALSDVESAARFLLERWPASYAGTKLHRAARASALNVLTGKGSTAVFRAAMVTAAKEADIYADPPAEPEKLLPGHIAEPWRYGKKRRRR